MTGKFAFFTGSSFSLPAIQYLQAQGRLACVVLVDAEPNPDLMQLTQALNQLEITVLKYSADNVAPFIAALDASSARYGIVYLFRHKISTALINYFHQDIYNIHPSDLPQYKGPMPLYWQVRDGISCTQLTVHRVTPEIDSGEIGAQLEMPIHPFETLVCVYQKSAQLIPQLLHQFMNQLESGTVEWRQQNNRVYPSAPFPQPEDSMVNWEEHTASDIVNMARAGCGDFGSIRIRFHTHDIQLIQASKQELSVAGLPPGTVIEVGLNSGVVVATKDGAVKLDIIATPQGIFDGYRFSLLYGMDAGMMLSPV
ncbi:methionyl-tRNA formyltransferase [Photobacterium sp. TY1-4]|uniref:methionyl-tRNA formyltransferase n=1 Tax=Photobacterium sp. TY1-4 TaxID=2899122 RepID=UPI0021BFFB21|nr:formyltransferase family protein [Photobacterium sp. TY1-4]UXI03216.1 hypothetical protein NH461_22530 [Photobacterium sp. TY1-4]